MATWLQYFVVIVEKEGREQISFDKVTRIFPNQQRNEGLKTSLHSSLPLSPFPPQNRRLSLYKASGLQEVRIV